MEALALVVCTSECRVVHPSVVSSPLLAIGDGRREG